MKGLKNNKKRWNDGLSQIPWDKFEALIAEYYTQQGYRVAHVGTGNNGAKFDGGIDIKLYKDDKYIIVQCKHWNAKQVPHNDVHQLIGLLATEKADSGIFVTSGEYTAAARQAAAKCCNIELVDGFVLRQRLVNILDAMHKPVDSNNTKWRDEVEYRKPTQPRTLAEPWMPVESWKRAEPRKPTEHKPLEYANSKKSWNRNRKKDLTVEHFVVKFILPILFLMFVLKIIPSMFSNVVKRPQNLVVPSQTLQAPTQVYPVTTQTRPVRPSPVNWNPTRPIIRSPQAKQSDERNAPNNDAIAPMDMKEWERRNRESMKVLEKTTPEL